MKEKEENVRIMNIHVSRRKLLEGGNGYKRISGMRKM